MLQTPQPLAIYRLRLVLAGISPMIWRRLLVSSETSIAQLHEYIQVVFAWSGEHLHCFRIQEKDYGVGFPGAIGFDDDARQVNLSRFRLHPRECFRYDYDFTANWRVAIRLEQILVRRGRRDLPVCTGGGGAAPGEEYAGAAAYLQQLDRHRYDFPFDDVETMAEAMRTWLNAGGSREALGDIEELREAFERVTSYQEFQPRRCDRRHINRRLRAISQEAAA